MTQIYKNQKENPKNRTTIQQQSYKPKVTPLQFVDNRPETKRIKELQKIADNSLCTQQKNYGNIIQRQKDSVSMLWTNNRDQSEVAKLINHAKEHNLNVNFYISDILCTQTNRDKTSFLTQHSVNYSPSCFGMLKHYVFKSKDIAVANNSKEILLANKKIFKISDFYYISIQTSKSTQVLPTEADQNINTKNIELDDTPRERVYLSDNKKVKSQLSEEEKRVLPEELQPQTINIRAIDLQNSSPSSQSLADNQNIVTLNLNNKYKLAKQLSNKENWNLFDHDITITSINGILHYSNMLKIVANNITFYYINTNNVDLFEDPEEFLTLDGVNNTTFIISEKVANIQKSGSKTDRYGRVTIERYEQNKELTEEEKKLISQYESDLLLHESSGQNRYISTTTEFRHPFLQQFLYSNNNNRKNLSLIGPGIIPEDDNTFYSPMLMEILAAMHPNANVKVFDYTDISHLLPYKGNINTIKNNFNNSFNRVVHENKIGDMDINYDESYTQDLRRNLRAISDNNISDNYTFVKKDLNTIIDDNSEFKDDIKDSKIVVATQVLLHTAGGINAYKSFAKKIDKNETVYPEEYPDEFNIRTKFVDSLAKGTTLICEDKILYYMIKNGVFTDKLELNRSIDLLKGEGNPRYSFYTKL
jgi:hypothetical protein